MKKRKKIKNKRKSFKLTRTVLCFLVIIVNTDEETGCPVDIDHVCETCTKERNRWGCYCELDDGDGFVTTNLLTPCPDGL